MTCHRFRLRRCWNAGRRNSISRDPVSSLHTCFRSLTVWFSSRLKCRVRLVTSCLRFQHLRRALLTESNDSSLWTQAGHEPSVAFGRSRLQQHCAFRLVCFLLNPLPMCLITSLPSKLLKNPSIYEQPPPKSSSPSQLCPRSNQSSCSVVSSGYLAWCILRESPEHLKLYAGSPERS